MSVYVYPGLPTIIEAACEEYHITKEEFLSKKRDREYVEARYIAAWYCMEKRRMTLKKTASLINRDHCTVLHACKQVENWKQTDPVFLERLHRVLNAVNTDKATV